MKKNSHRYYGFSLLELSIVLVIVGLLLGAAVGGQHLIRSMRLRHIVTDYQLYQTAIVTFADKYNALPGDMPNATSYWGSVSSSNDCLAPTAGGANGNNASSGTGTQTCNGSGEWIIGDRDNSAQDFERFRTWQHLALGGMINGTYTGIAGSNGSLEHNVGENAPKSAIPSSGWEIMQISNYSANVNTNNPFFNRKYGNLLMFGGERLTSVPDNAIITPQEARKIDEKLDDASPVTGIISAVLSSWSPEKDCTTAAGASYPVNINITYNTNIEYNACVLYFLLPEDVRGPNG